MLRAILAVLVGGLLLAGCGGAPAPDPRPEDLPRTTPGRAAVRAPADDAPTVALTRTVVDALAERSGPSDRQFLRDGVWESIGGFPCWYCRLGAGTGAAALARRTAGPDAARYRAMAVASFDRLIADHVLPDGSIGPPLAGQGGREIATVFAAAELGTAYLLLRDGLGAGRRERWATTLSRAAEFLDGKLRRYYVNGNINLGVSVVADVAATVPGATAEDQDRADRLRRFALRPDTQQSSGFGLVVRRRAGADGKGAAGYLAEADKGTGPRGYDAEYTGVQVSFLARTVALLGRPEDVRLLDLLTNQTLERVDPATSSLLDTSRGTRHPDGSREVLFVSAGPAALLYRGGRSDLAARVRSNIDHLREPLTNPPADGAFGVVDNLHGHAATLGVTIAAALPPVAAAAGR